LINNFSGFGRSGFENTYKPEHAVNKKIRKKMSEPVINVGQAINRVDGLLKVTGTATYATDYVIKNTAHAVIFKSTIAAGSISDIDTTEAEKAAGVLAVITHKNAPKLNGEGGIRGGALLQSSNIEFYGQHIGLVVAETFEQARHATRLIKVSYEKADAKVDFEKHGKEAVLPKDKDKADAVRGDVDAAFRNAEYKIEAVYETPVEHHHPMEPHATIACVKSGKFRRIKG
jgi:xanthine dehydrogenase YagR molybdenum-binding subunit